MRIIYWLILAATIVPVRAVAQSTDPLENEIANAMVGNVVTIRHFYAGSNLHYNTEGDLVDKRESGPWTLTGRIRINNVSVKDDHVQLGGNRIWVSFKGAGKEVNGITKIPVEVRVDLLPGTVRTTKWRQIVSKVFVTKASSIAEDAPPYWKKYLAGERKGSDQATIMPPNPTPIDPAAGSKSPSTEGATKLDNARQSQAAQESIPAIPNASVPLHQELRRPLKVSQGVTEGLITHKVVPEYPNEARAAHHQGTVVMQAILGKEGKLLDLQIVSPAGMGLDDAAARAVSQWVYRPYLLKGEPVEVDTHIIVNFKLQ